MAIFWGMDFLFILGNVDTPADTATLLQDIDLHLSNVNFLTAHAKSLAPNTKYVGGLHLRKGKTLNQVKIRVALSYFLFKYKTNSKFTLSRS
jgi:hypothetical protein